jgi:hypothetical protein
MYKLLNNEKVELTEAEETARIAEIEQANIRRQARETAKQNETNKKASGKQKLKDLGLDDDEIQALMGV